MTQPSPQPSPGPAAQPFAGVPAPDELTADDKLWGMLAYLIFPLLIGAIIALVTRSASKFVKFHALQMIFLAIAVFLIYFALWIVLLVFMFIPGINVIMAILMIPIYGLLCLAFLGAIIYLALKANSGLIVRLPVIGDLAYKNAYGA